MRLRHYLRGLGLGIVVSTLIISAGKRGSAAELTDDEIRVRARALGMVEEDEMLLSEARQLADSAAKKADEDKMSESRDGIPRAGASVELSPGNTLSSGTVSAETVSSGTVSSQAASFQVSSDSPSLKAELSEQTGNREDPGATGSFKGAGAESALEPGKKDQRPAQKTGALPDGDKETDREELVSDAGRGSSPSPLKAASSSDKKTSSSSDRRTSSSSDRRTSSSSDRTTSSSSDRTTSSSSDKKTSSSSDKKTSSSSDKNTSSSSEKKAESSGVTIVKGESSTAVAKKLQQAGIVPDAMQFDRYLCLNGYDRHLVVGVHAIPAGASARDIAEIITSK